MDEPWYKDGLKFTCTQCGHCCTGEPGFVWVDDGEIAAIAAYLGEPRREFEAVRTRKSRGQVTLREKANGDCVLYDKAHGCTVYPVAAAAVSHLAVLGEQLEVAGRMGANRASLPRQRRRGTDSGRGDRETPESHRDVKP